KNDYPDLKYKVVELPAGPAGKATLQFTNCWGLAADSKDKADAKKLAEYLTEAEQQNTFAKDFGVMPSVKSAAEAWKKANPALAAFLDGADYAQNVPTAKGATDVLDEL
ncbi:extracellular solute-binding protein, partial [Pauljensenia sp. UMB0018B]|nr:extracellular solute-binding protein [Pauljensenia sp. UMB0018B]